MLKLKKLFILFFLVTGCCVTGYGILHIHTALKCQDWLVTRGQIIGAMVNETVDISNNRTRKNYIPDIAYEYSYNNRTYFKQTIGYFPASIMGWHDSYYAGSEEELLSFITQYPIDIEVDVFVNPEMPEESVLDSSLKLPALIPFLFGCLLLYLAFHLFIFGDKYLPLKQENIYQCEK